jgi:hypothetical protein
VGPLVVTPRCHAKNNFASEALAIERHASFESSATPARRSIKNGVGMVTVSPHARQKERRQGVSSVNLIIRFGISITR